MTSDSNLVVCQTKGSFSLKEPSLASYKAMAQKMEEKFSTFEIEHAPRNENRYVDALAMLGLQIVFEGDSTRIEVSKRNESIVEVLKERFQEEQCEEDWRIPIKEVLTREEDMAKLKALKDYALVRGEFYCRMSSGFLPRCVGQEEAQRKLKEVHDKTCGFCGEVNLYRRLQRAGFYWPSMGKDVDQVQIQCETYQLTADREESYTVFISEDWRSPFVQHLTEGILPQRHSERYKLKRLTIRYFLHDRVLFKKAYDRDPLQCLGLEEASEMIKEVHTRECGEHQGKKNLYRFLLQMGYYWSTMKRDSTKFLKKWHSCQVQANLIHTHLQNLHSMVIP